jgi:hypothetical protein
MANITKQDMQDAVYIRDGGPDWGTVRYAGAAGWCVSYKLEGKRKKVDYRRTREGAQIHLDRIMDGK